MSIIIEDQTDKLTLLHYEGSVSDQTEQHIKNVRGTITDEKFDTIVSTFGFTPEYTVKEREKYVDLLTDVSTCTVYRAEEGTLLRLFFHDHQWNLSTFKRLNAFDSRWSSTKTFGELFIEALHYFYTHGKGKNTLFYEVENLFDVFCNTLDRTLVYTFLLRTNNDTKIVCNHPEHPTLFFSGCFINGVLSKENPLLIPFPEQLHFSTLTDLELYVESINPFNVQGVLIILPDQTTVKISNSLYSTYKLIRGSEPDIEMAYFRVRKHQPDLELFQKMFTHVKVTDIESNVTLMITYLHRMYVRRFIKKLYTMLHPTLFYILRKAHLWHKENREQHIVTLEKMTSFIEEQNGVSIYRMYKEYTSHEANKDKKNKGM